MEIDYVCIPLLTTWNVFIFPYLTDFGTRSVHIDNRLQLFVSPPAVGNFRALPVVFGKCFFKQYSNTTHIYQPVSVKHLQTFSSILN